MAVADTQHGQCEQSYHVFNQTWNPWQVADGCRTFLDLKWSNLVIPKIPKRYKYLTHAHTHPPTRAHLRLSPYPDPRFQKSCPMEYTVERSAQWHALLKVISACYRCLGSIMICYNTDVLQHVHACSEAIQNVGHWRYQALVVGSAL